MRFRAWMRVFCGHSRAFVLAAVVGRRFFVVILVVSGSSTSSMLLLRGNSRAFGVAAVEIN